MLSADQRAVLIYDAECAACRASALWLMRRALFHGALEVLPYRSGPRRDRYPRISEEACAKAMQLVLPDGRVLTDADAVPELLRRVRGWAWLAAAVGLPPVNAVSRRVYAWVAKRRLRVTCALHPGRR